MRELKKNKSPIMIQIVLRLLASRGATIYLERT